MVAIGGAKACEPDRQTLPGLVFRELSSNLIKLDSRVQLREGLLLFRVFRTQYVSDVNALAWV